MESVRSAPTPAVTGTGPAPGPFEVAVIIPSYRSGATLGRCLEALARQRSGRRYAVHVVHSGEEGPAAATVASFASVNFHVHAERWLPGRARNWAARRVEAPWVLFLDSDCLVEETWIDDMMDGAMRTGADGAGGSVRNATPWGLCAWVMHLLEFGEWLPGGPPRDCQNFPSCNAIYRRAALLEVGGFPEWLFPGEDTACNYLLHERGRRLVFLPACPVGHVHRRNLVGLLRHNHALGLSYGQACRVHPLPGSVLGRLWRPAIPPAVVLVRYARTVRRLLPCRPLELMVLLAATPLVLLALAAWGRGFAAAMAGPSPGRVADSPGA